MTFLAPGALWGLLAVPLMVAGYVVVTWRRRRSLPAAFTVTGPGPTTMAGWRRHAPAGLFLTALALLLTSFARPEADLTLPTLTGQIILAFDTSNSMMADDVDPTRLDVAKRIAGDFVDRQPGSVQIGVVAFTNGGVVLEPPTKDQTAVRASIDRLTTDGGTSIGEGIFAALTAIADDPIVVDPEVIGVDITALDIGFFSNAAIVVFTDGEEIGGADPLDLAGLAANAGVAVYTVGIGTERGAVVPLDGFSIATALDQRLLTDIAESTGGAYYLADDDPSLTGIFDAIDRSFEQHGERVEVTAVFALVAIVFMLAGTVVSLRWFGRL